MKDCIDILKTPVSSIFNLSLTEGSFPSHFKSTLVSPLLEIPSPNKKYMKNNRPVSNLTLLIFFRIRMLTYKTLHEKQSVYLHSMLVTSLPSHSLRSNNRISLSVLRVKTNTEAWGFSVLCPIPLEQPPTVCPCSAISTEIFRKHLNTCISLTWPVPPCGHQHTWWPVDVIELLCWFCCWSLIQLSRHWAWLCQGYWHYRNLIDRLIDCLFQFLQPPSTSHDRPG